MKLNKNTLVSQLVALGVNPQAIYEAILHGLGGDKNGYTYKAGDQSQEMAILPSWKEFMADQPWRDHRCEVRIDVRPAVKVEETIQEFQLSRGDFGYAGDVKLYGLQMKDFSTRSFELDPRLSLLFFNERCSLKRIDLANIEAVARLEYSSPFDLGGWQLVFCEFDLSAVRVFAGLRKEIANLVAQLDPEGLIKLKDEFFEGSPEILKDGGQYFQETSKKAWKRRDLAGYLPDATLEEIFFLADKLGVQL